MIRKALLLSVAVLASTAVPASAAPTWLPSGTITGGWFPVPAINDDGLTAIAMEGRPAPTARVTTGALGQSTFPEPVTFESPAPAASSYPDVAINARGDVAVVWGDTQHVWLAVKPAGGAFGEPIEAGATGGFVPHPGPQVGIADDGDIALAWETFGPGTATTHWAVKPAGEPVGTPGSSFWNNSGTPALSMSGDGTTVVAFAGPVEGAATGLKVVTRTPDGAFGPPAVLSDTAQPSRAPVAAAADGGAAVVAWLRYDGAHWVAQASRRVAGGDFSVAKDLSAAGANAGDLDVDLNDSGESVLTWRRSGAVQAALGTLAGGFQPLTDFGPGSGPRAAVAGTGAAIVTWFDGTGISASLRPPAGAFPAPASVAPHADTLGGSAAAPVVMDADGDVLMTFLPNGYNDVGYRVLDAAGPRLNELAVPGTATATEPVALSVAPADAFSAVTSTHWDFGDGSSADGPSVSHAFGTSGTFTVKVTSTDAVGNATTATRTLDVAPKIAQAAPAPPGGGTLTVPPPPPGSAKPCNVPSLKGLTRAKAKAKLTKAHCALGRTITPKKLRKVKGLVVVKQSRKAGTVVKAGTKVTITLGKKPKGQRR